MQDVHVWWAAVKARGGGRRWGGVGWGRGCGRGICIHTTCFPRGVSGKEPACQCRLDIRDVGSIPGWGRSPGERNGNSLEHSCLENPKVRGAWQAIQFIGSQSQTRLKRF